MRSEVKQITALLAFQMHAVLTQGCLRCDILNNGRMFESLRSCSSDVIDNTMHIYFENIMFL